MNKKTYFDSLRSCLSSVPKEEQNKLIEYYAEIINDKIENGMTEQAALEELGTPEQLARQILEDNPKLPKYPVHTSGRAGAVVGFSLLIPFVIILFAVLLVLSVSFLVIPFSMLLAGLLYFFASFVTMFNGFAAGLMQTGISLSVFALGILLFYPTVLFGKTCLNTVVAIVKKYMRVYHIGGCRHV